MSSNYPPNPQYPSPKGQPYGAPQEPKKGGALKWVLLGCGGITVLGIVVVVAVVLFGLHKAKQMGLDPEMMQNKPTEAAARIFCAANKDVEFVSADEASKTFTYRDKKSGKLITISVDDTNKGNLSIKSDTGESFSIGGSSAAEVPDWVPSYPGAEPTGFTTSKTSAGKSGVFGFSTDDSPAEVMQFYEDGLKGDGFKESVKTNSGSESGSGGMLVFEDSNKTRTVSVMVGSEGTGSKVTISYTIKQ